MNIKIKRFSEQAINYATSNQPLPDLKDKDLFLNNLFERFAELIVQECVEQILTGVRTNPPQAEPTELVQTLVRRIQQHFGVAE